MTSREEIQAEWSDEEREYRCFKAPDQYHPLLPKSKPWTVPVVKTPQFGKKVLPGESYMDEPPKSY